MATAHYAFVQIIRNFGIPNVRPGYTAAMIYTSMCGNGSSAQRTPMDSDILTYDDYVEAAYEQSCSARFSEMLTTSYFEGSEIQYVWSHPKSRSSYFFFFLRYFGSLSMISVIAVEFYPLEKEGEYQPASISPA
ncbi:hypothetical protein L218DRAFT_944990 [Marasmius fiardii PR-910]|nr:hypothetical protein L218DRAFT_944990 [Marasmius fiardii PR-910]